MRRSRYQEYIDLAKKLAHAAVARVAGKDVLEAISDSDENRQKVYMLFNEIAEHADKLKRLTIVVLDEAQNLLRRLRGFGEEWGYTVWSFVKVLSSIQEQSVYTRFVIVASDYFFHEEVFLSTPSLDYIRYILPGQAGPRQC